MPRRRRLTKSRIGSLLLDRDHDDEMDLQLGLVARGDERMRRLWFGQREDLIADGPLGTRPGAFYVFELGLDGCPDPVHEVDWLRKHGHLTVFEERELKRQREERARQREARSAS